MSTKSFKIGDLVWRFPGARLFKVIGIVKTSDEGLHYVLEGVDLFAGSPFIFSETLLQHYEVSNA